MAQTKTLNESEPVIRLDKIPYFGSERVAERIAERTAERSARLRSIGPHRYRSLRQSKPSLPQEAVPQEAVIDAVVSPVGLESAIVAGGFNFDDMNGTLHGRCIGLLVADGSDEDQIAAVRVAVSAAGATLKVVAPKLGGIVLAGGEPLAADAQLSGTPSERFDAIVVILSATGADALCDDAAALDFVLDAYCQLKPLGVDRGARALLHRAGVAPGAGVVDIGDTRAFIASAKARQWARGASAPAIA